MTRMLWLRIIAIGAGILQALYYGVWLSRSRRHVLGDRCSSWSMSGRSPIIAYRNRTARTSTPDERAFYEIAIPTLEPADARPPAPRRAVAARPSRARCSPARARMPDDPRLHRLRRRRSSRRRPQGRRLQRRKLRRRDQRVVRHPASATATTVAPRPATSRFTAAFIATTLDRLGEIGHGARTGLPPRPSRQAAADQRGDGDGSPPTGPR